MEMQGMQVNTRVVLDVGIHEIVAVVLCTTIAKNDRLHLWVPIQEIY